MGDVLIAQQRFTVQHNLSCEADLHDLDYLEAMLLASGLIAECVELQSSGSGDYPYTKEQFAALVSSHIQYDSIAINKKMNDLALKSAKNIHAVLVNVSKGD